jgi:hypothetical protein
MKVEDEISQEEKIIVDFVSRALLGEKIKADDLRALPPKVALKIIAITIKEMRKREHNLHLPKESPVPNNADRK